MDNIGVGIVLIVVGVGLLALTPFLLRLFPRKAKQDEQVDFESALTADLTPNDSAVLVIQAGGKVIYLNEQARQWFDLAENASPNLERLSRRTRPADVFLSLCASAGRTRFTLNQMLVEGISYTLPYQNQRAVLVSLTRPKLTGLDDKPDSRSNQAVAIFTEISQAMSASLDLETTIETILESIDRLIPSDFSEITLWNPEGAYFEPYRYLTEEDGIRRLRPSSTFYGMDKGYTGYLVNKRKAVLISNAIAFQAARPAVSRSQFPIQSYLGCALKIGNQLIGTLELASQQEESFTFQDKEILDLLSGHAAVALQNAVTHHKEHERVREMTGLAELAQVSSSIQNPQNIYQQILDTISPLIEVEILGFLIYNEQTRSLEGQVPFRGFPEQFTELYRTELEEGSEAEHIWNEQDIIITSDISESSVIGRLGLAPLAQASAIRETALIPLSSGTRKLGYLQAANKHDGSQFTENDLRLLRIVAGQIAPILENASLIQQSRRRTQRAEALRRVASLAGSEATQDEALQFSLLEISRFLQADIAAVFLLDEGLGTLQIHESSSIGFSSEALGKISLHLITQANLNNTVTETHMPISSDNMATDETLAQPYRALQPLLPDVHSLMVSPLVARGRSLGEILIGSKSRNMFDFSDQQSLETAADQIASAIERATLITQTDKDLQRKADELSTLHRLTRQISVTDNIENILKVVLQEALRISEADDGGILLFERSANGNSPVKISSGVGNTSASLTKLDQLAINRKEVTYIPDLPSSNLSEEHPGMVSALAIPLTRFGKMVGLLRLFSKSTDRFDQTTQDLLQMLASQTGITLSNLWEYQEASENTANLLDQANVLSKLLEVRKQISAETPLADAARILTQAVRQASPFEVVLAYAYDARIRMLRPLALTGLRAEDAAVAAEIAQPWEKVQTLTQPEYSLGRAYLVPANKLDSQQSLIPEFVHIPYAATNGQNSWTPGDQLLLPLMDGQNQPLGLFLFDAPQNGEKPAATTLELLYLFATEMGLLIEREAKISTLRDQITQIETQINRSAQANGDGQQPHLSVMLKKDLEQTLALQQLYHRARNIRIGLDIAENVNRQPDRQSVLNSLASQMLTEMELDVALVVESSSGGPRLIGQFGPLSQNANPQALLGQRNPLRQTLQTGEVLVSPNLDESSEWRNTPLLRSLDAKAFVCLPIHSDNEVEAAVLAISNTTPMGELTQEDEQVFELIGNQVSLTLQNLNLLTETRRRLREVNLLLDFSRQLGSLDPNEILTSMVKSVRRVFPHAHGVRIMFWDEEQQALITQAAAGYNDNNVLANVSHRLGSSIIGRAYQNG
ncbi:MAG: GAF domain-containing protein, partial [Anaerolineales bacterium]